MKVEWDYTKLAESYVNRPEYSPSALSNMFNTMNLHEGAMVCDFGAGVAHLTLHLLEKGYVVDAVEPNDEMRRLGKEKTKKYKNVSWCDGTGENTGMDSEKYNLVTFGSSFNVTDRTQALRETARILKPKSWFACMWNHRDLENSLQKKIEDIITSFIPDYNYGSRREDQKSIVTQSGLFQNVKYVEGGVVHTVSKKNYIDAWRSHATLERQAGDKLGDILSKIDYAINDVDNKDSIVVPYTTRIWFAQKN